MTSASAVQPLSTHTTSNLSILYLGCNAGTSRHRALSLSRLGHKVQIVDPYSFLPSGRLTDYWIFHAGAYGLGKCIRDRVLAKIGSAQFDLVWVDAGSLVGAELVRDLKRQATFVLNYNVDDPFGTRDGLKWRLYLRSVPSYDLVAVVRDCNVAEAYMRGATDVLRVHRSSDEVAHAPRRLSPVPKSPSSRVRSSLSTPLRQQTRRRRPLPHRRPPPRRPRRCRRRRAAPPARSLHRTPPQRISSPGIPEPVLPAPHRRHPRQTRPEGPQTMEETVCAPVGSTDRRAAPESRC